MSRRAPPISNASLIIACLAATTLPLGLLALPSPDGLPAGLRGTGALLWVLGFVPAWHYLLASPTRRPPTPLLPVVGVLHSLYYSLSLLLGRTNVYGFLPQQLGLAEYEIAATMALGGWCALLGGYALASTFRPPGAKAFQGLGSGFDAATLQRTGFAFVGAGLAADVATAVIELTTLRHTPVMMLGSVKLVGFTLLIALSRRGRLAPSVRLRLWAAVAVAAFIQLGMGATFNVINLTFTLFVAGWIGRPRVRMRTIVLALLAGATFAAVRGLMTTWRAVVWSTTGMTSVERSLLMVDIASDAIGRKGVPAVVGEGLDVIARRSSNLDLFADVVLRTPREIPWWNGETYLSLVGALVPRALWPDKPVKTLGQQFGHRYGYLHESDRATSINLPYLIEFYANFGMVGVIAGMLLVGVIYRVVERYLNSPGQPLALSALSAPLLLPLYVIECDFSLQFGGLPLQGAALATAVLGALVIDRALRRGARKAQARARARDLEFAAHSGRLVQLALARAGDRPSSRPHRTHTSTVVIRARARRDERLSPGADRRELLA